MKTQYIIVERDTGEIWTANRIQRVYSTLKGARSQIHVDSYKWAILELTLGPTPILKMIPVCKITEKVWDQQIRTELGAFDDRIADLSARAKPGSYLLQYIDTIKERRQEVIDLQYKNLMYK